VTTARTRIKFCGITRNEDALAAANLGVDAIGLVLTRRSPRCVTIDQARAIRRALPPFLAVVTLFMDDEIGFIAEAVSAVAPDLLQFHGSETAADCVRYGRPYLKAVPMASAASVRQGTPSADDWRAVIASHPGAAAFVLDGHAAGGQGGSGNRFDWSIEVRAGKPLLLAGGLTEANVGEAIRAARPYAVDVSSGIEATLGVKDPEKMRRFVAAVRTCD
jgi:phosphoribosylanthranilate isomerase